MPNNKPIILWLLSGCFLIFLMVVVGGITRLTNSGLSMVEWHLFMGAIPPLNHAEWEEVFNAYKQFPEYQIKNYDFTLNEFKQIFFWEYLHRMIGRVLGLVFIFPFIYFLINKMLSKKLIVQSIILLLMGSLQGFIGWWMVKSGLVDNPDVSHFRLAVHLITAFLTFGYILWVLLPLIYTGYIEGDNMFYKFSIILFCLIVAQIIYGAFVAGLEGGIGFNTWPKMGGQWVPDGVYSMKGLWHPLEGRYGVQFIHRMLAFLIAGFTLYMWLKGRKVFVKKSTKKILNILLGIVILQIILGILTLILHVPILLAISHQFGAFLLLSTCVYAIFIFSKKKSLYL